MVILAVSDLHGETAWLPQAVERLGPDLLVCAGDWGDPGQVSEAAFDPILERVQVLSVTGNHDDRPLLAGLANRDGSPVLLAQGEARRVGDLTIAGISGIWAKTRLGSRLNRQWENARRRNPTLTLDAWLAGREMPPYVTDEEVAALAAGIARTPVDLLVSHGCPLGLADRTPGGGRGGQHCFRRAFEVTRPSVYVCGHIHRRQRVDTPDGRLVLNAGHGAEGQGWLLTLAEGRWSAEAIGGCPA